MPTFRKPINQKQPVGDCYAFVFREAQHLPDHARVVHGWMVDPWSKQRLEHAWIEVDGEAYDWQLRRMQTLRSLPLTDYYSMWRTSQDQAYSPRELVASVLKYRFFGPFDFSSADDDFEEGVSASTKPDAEADL